jgi:hypothetical protein
VTYQYDFVFAFFGGSVVVGGGGARRQSPAPFPVVVAVRFAADLAPSRGRPVRAIDAVAISPPQRLNKLGDVVCVFR